MRRASPVALAAALAVLSSLAAGCEAGVQPCPGDPQGTLAFAGSVDPSATSCAFPVAGSTDFVATVSFTGSTTAVLCVQKPLAVSRPGARAGDAVSIQLTLPQVTIGSCPCAVDILETLSGTLQRTPGSTAVGFSGTLVDRITRSAGAAACYLSADPAAVAAACPGAPDPLSTPPSDGGCDAAYALSAPPG